MKYRDVSAGQTEFSPLYSVLSLLSYMLKAPLVKPGAHSPVALPLRCGDADLVCTGTDVVNSLNRQRNALETFLKACIGIEGSSDLLLQTRIW